MSGSKKGGGTPTPNPIVADDTERTISTVVLVDVISEGPILGLVNGAKSIFFNSEQWMLDSGNFQLQGVQAHFRHGWSEQEPLPYRYIAQTFDVNQVLKSSMNSIELVNDTTTNGTPIIFDKELTGRTRLIDISRGVIVANTLGGGIDPPIALGDPGTGQKQTAVPTQKPIVNIVDYDTDHYKAVVSNPGANVIGGGTGQATLFYTYFYNLNERTPSSPSGPGWELGPNAQLIGGVVRTVTNPYAKAIRFIIKVDKLFQESGNGDVQPATLRFAVQYRHDEADTLYPDRAGVWENGLVLYGNQRWTSVWASSLWPLMPASGEYMKVEVKLRVQPFTRFRVKHQAKDNTNTTWLDQLYDDSHQSVPGYYNIQEGFNGSASPQIMHVTLYINIPINGVDNRIIDDFGGDILECNWYRRATVSGLSQTNEGVHVFHAKTQNGVQLDFTMVLPSRFNSDGNRTHLKNMQIRVIKLTPDDVYVGIDTPSVATAIGLTADNTVGRGNFWITYHSVSWGAYIELMEEGIQYADTAVMGLELNSQWTGSSIPSRAYDVYGRIVRVPSNYDAFNHVYEGLWDGTFALSWTDNPVWIFLDLLTHDRYGLGQWISDDLIDLAAMYQVAQYCDEPVQTDGDTSPCPRFTFNTQIIAQDQAYNVLAMLSSAFRGMVYWAAGGITVTQDSPKTPTRIVSPSNVINGDFQYVGSSLQARHSVVLVSWQDQENFGKDRVDVYEDPQLIDRYGYATTELKAWGCTRFSQAMRMARWLLETEKHATEVVTYRAGFDHADARPGEVVAVADPTISGVRHAGRIVQGNTVTIYMDATFAFDPTESYTLTIPIPTWGAVSVRNGSTSVVGSRTSFTIMGAFDVIMFHGDPKQYNVTITDNFNLTLSEPYQGPDQTGIDFTVLASDLGGGPATFVASSLIPIVERAISNPGEAATFFNLSSPLPMAPNSNAQFIITGSSVEPRLFTIVSNREIDTHTYEINALAYDPAKFDRVEVQP